MNIFFGFSCTLLLAVILSGCSGREETFASPPVDNYSEQVSSNSAGMVKDASVVKGKPGARVALTGAGIFNVEPGVPAQITLSLTAPETGGVMNVGVKGSEGLTILSETEFSFFLDSPEHLLPVQIVANAPGRYYVHLQVSVKNQGRETFRALSAIVQAGAKDTQAGLVQKNSAETSSAAAPIIVLPAQETVQQEEALQKDALHKETLQEKTVQ